ncbi:receptor-like protein 56 [Oryza brachyantha]|nr:receptor-like protein 56 [Oryza brachyantha]
MANFSSLKALVLSNNIELRIETEFPSWVPSFQLEHLALDNCIINKHSNGKIPTFLLGQRSILDLDLSGSFLSGTIPLELFYSISNSLSLRKNSLEIVEKFSLENGTSRLGMLDFSDNQIAMQLPSAFGTIFPALIYLNMSHNALYGHIPSIGPDVLEVLDLSNNHLEGVIPESLTTFPSALKYLILSNNKLQGGLLPKNSSMFMLLHLDLENNHLEGNLPPELRKSTMLKILNANNNKLSGTIPSWLFSYEGLLELSVILFKGNHLEGSIPKEWCNTINLHILDLSNNSLSGNIPDCLSDFANAYFSNLYSNNLYFPNGIKRANIPDQNIFNESYGINKESNEVTINITTKGTSMQYRGLPLEFYIGIDLSMNHLSGNIPLNLGFVPGLKSLNLSRNHLRGTIPDTFQNSLSLESLDLSHNYINGNIPSGLTQLSSLSSFNVAHNNLSGEVPYTGQFPTFDKSFFEGNPDLCGEAVEKKCCTTNITFGLWKMDIIDSPIIYWSFVFGSFATGFWATIAVLMWNSSLREKWFSAVDHLITGWN